MPKFVQSRVEKIRNNSVKWRHCPGKANPADIPSRGLEISKPETKKKWLFGAEFLSQDETFWPKTPNLEKSTEFLGNAMDNNVCLVNSVKEVDLYDVIDSKRHSSIHKLLRVTSYVMRFIKNIKLKIAKSTLIKSELTMDELEDAKKLWIINEQRVTVTDKKLMNNLSNTLGIFEDVDGIYRLRGRLQDSDLDAMAKYPISQ